MGSETACGWGWRRLLQAEPEPGTAAHICWIALMSDAFDVLSPLERDAVVGWMALQTEGRANEPRGLA